MPKINNVLYWLVNLDQLMIISNNNNSSSITDSLVKGDDTNLGF